MTPIRRWSARPRSVLAKARGLVLTVLVVSATACVQHADYERVPSLERGDDPIGLLYLVGDAGEDSPARDAVLAHLRGELAVQSSVRPDVPAVVAFLGDNIYEAGARRGYRAEDVTHLAAQAAALGERPNVRGVFLPGNHGWSRGAGDERARRAILLQQEWIADLARGRRVDFLPRDACPGPAVETLAPGVRLLYIDTEWLLRIPDDDCGSDGDFYDRLAAQLVQHEDDRVVLMSHHPMATGGPHGGNVSLWERAPLIYFLAVKAGLNVQDLASGRYSTMLGGLRRAYRESGSPPLVHAAGHDHSLQVIALGGYDEPRYQLVSGSASKSSPVESVPGMRYATAAPGYMRLSFERNQTRLTVFAGEHGAPPEIVFECVLEGDAQEAHGCREAPSR